MINFENFTALHPHGRRLTIDFYERARNERRNSFAGFMHIWMSFNGWMSFVTGLVRDADMVKAVAKDHHLNQIFTHLMDEQGGFFDSVSQFSNYWPIFNSQHVHAKLGQNFIYEFENREEFVANIIDNPGIGRRPSDWVLGQVPSWPDLLQAIYQVRCNLFHGNKSPLNNIDHELVDLAFATLSKFIEYSGIYRQD